MIVHTTSLYLIIILLFLLYTPVVLMVQFLALCITPCISRLCMTLSTHALSYTIHLLMTYNYRCLLNLMKYLSYFTLCSRVYVMSKLGQLRTCLDIMTRQNSCLSPLKTKHLHNMPTSITIGNAQIPFKQSVNNLGLTLDCHLTMNAHVSNIARHATLNCVVCHLFVDS